MYQNDLLIITIAVDFIQQIQKTTYLIMMLFLKENISLVETVNIVRESNQGNHDSSGNQKNAIQGQRPDVKNRQTQQRT